MLIASGTHKRIRWYIQRDGVSLQVWISYPAGAKNRQVDETVRTMDEAYTLIHQYINRYEV